MTGAVEYGDESDLGAIVGRLSDTERNRMKFPVSVFNGNQDEEDDRTWYRVRRRTPARGFEGALDKLGV